MAFVLAVDEIALDTNVAVVVSPVDRGGCSPFLFGGFGILLTYLIFGIASLFVATLPLLILMQQS